MKFTEYIYKTIDNRRGYKWGRCWRTEVEKSVISLYHYGTCILKWRGSDVIHFRLGSVSDNQAINAALPSGMWCGYWYDRWGHFTKKINGVNIDTIHSITDSRRTETKYICNINGKLTECKKLNAEIKFRSGKFFHIGNDDNALIRIISKRKRPFKYKRSVTLWNCKKYKNIFPVASSMDGSEVYKFIRIKTKEAPEWFVNKCVARMV